jgi:hypothetical protein
MGWLDDLAMRRASEKRSQEQERIAHQADALRKVKEVRKMVISVLKEVGRAYWSSVNGSWKIEVTNSGLTSEHWSVRHDTSGNSWDYWGVQLSHRGSSGWHFSITCRGDYVSTNDTSEAELRRCIKLAVERGPKHDFYGS